MINQNLSRYDKAFKLVENRCVVLLKSGHAVVHSLDDKNIYHVNYREQICECLDHQFRQIRCCHILATLIKSGELKVVKDLIV